MINKTINTIILTSVLLVSLSIGYFIYSSMIHTVNDNLKQSLTIKAKLFTMRSTELYNALDRLYARLRLTSIPVPDMLQKTAVEYLIDFPEIQEIDWIGSNLVVEDSITRESELSRLNFDLKSNQPLYSSLQDAVVKRKAFITSALPLREGKTLSAIAFPLFTQGEFRGFLFAIINFNQILSRFSIQYNQPKDYRYTLLINNLRLGESPNPSTVNLHEKHCIDFSILNQTFKLCLQSNETSPSLVAPPLLRGVVALLVIIFLLTALSFYLIDANLRSNHKILKLRSKETKASKHLSSITTDYKELTDRYYLAVQSAHIGIWIWEIENDKLIWNHVMYEMYDVPKDAILSYETWYNTILDEDKERAEKAVMSAINGQKRLNTTFRIYANDKIKTIKANGTVNRNPDGSPYLFTGVNTDITEITQYEDILIESGMVFFQISLKKNSIAFSNSANIVLGIKQDCLGNYPLNTWIDNISEEFQSAYREHLSSFKNTSNNNNFAVCEYRIHRRNAPSLWICDVIINKINSSYEKNEVIIGYMQDISVRKNSEFNSIKAANHDPLTQLANLKLTKEKLHELTCAKKRNSDKFAILYIDLDGLKRINDTYGHDAGDEVLKKTAHYLSNNVRQTDWVSRIGGDEFLIILNKIENIEWASFHSNKLLQGLSVLKFSFDKHIKITASIGVSIFPDHSTNYKKLIKIADEAMYNIKNEGKNGVAIATLKPSP